MKDARDMFLDQISTASSIGLASFFSLQRAVEFVEDSAQSASLTRVAKVANRFQLSQKKLGWLGLAALPGMFWTGIQAAKRLWSGKSADQFNDWMTIGSLLLSAGSVVLFRLGPSLTPLRMVAAGLGFTLDAVDLGRVCMTGGSASEIATRAWFTLAFNLDRGGRGQFNQLFSRERTMKYWDVTQPITEKTIVFPGDPTFSVSTITALSRGDHFDLRHLSLGNHTGTHIDFPAHVLKGGQTSDAYPIESLINPGVIVEVPSHLKYIDDVFLNGLDQSLIRQNEAVLFKTTNSELLARGVYKEQFVALDHSAAVWLRKKGVKMVGIDYLSVDRIEAEDLPVHRELLSNGILILEGLNLSVVDGGRCKVYCFPLRVSAMDGLPARVVIGR